MTAYNKTHLYNKYVQEQASAAFRNKCIGEETYRSILVKHPQTLYTPNYFVRIGLALLAAVTIMLSMGLVWLVTGASSEEGIIMLLLFFAAVCYAMLEGMVKLKKYYNAGIDNILMVAVVLLVISCFLVYDFTDNGMPLSCIIMLVSAWLAIRFTDAFMTVVCFFAAISLFFLWYVTLGSFGTLTVPFAVMLLCGVIHFFLQQRVQRPQWVVYLYCVQWLLLLSLISFYAAGNYYLVNELSLEMFNKPAQLAWLFWIFTLLVPVVYTVYGIKQKQPLYYRTGVVLLIVAVLTVRYYYAVMPAEVAMLVFGLLITFASYFLIRYLSTARKGYTFEDTGHTEKNLLNAEALVVAQVFGKKTMPGHASVEFGGGSSGGGGASGNY